MADAFVCRTADLWLSLRAFNPQDQPLLWFLACTVFPDGGIDPADENQLQQIRKTLKWRKDTFARIVRLYADWCGEKQSDGRTNQRLLPAILRSQSYTRDTREIHERYKKTELSPLESKNESQKARKTAELQRRYKKTKLTLLKSHSGSDNSSEIPESDKIRESYKKTELSPLELHSGSDNTETCIYIKYNNNHETSLEVTSNSNTVISELSTRAAESGAVAPVGSGEPIAEKKRRPDDPLYRLFDQAFTEAYGIPYLSQSHDFIQLASLRKKCTAKNWQLTEQRFTRGLVNYMAGSQANKTLADLCARFPVFYRGETDRYGHYQQEKPNGTKQHTGQLGVAIWNAQRAAEICDGIETTGIPDRRSLSGLPGSNAAARPGKTNCLPDLVAGSDGGWNPGDALEHAV